MFTMHIQIGLTKPERPDNAASDISMDDMRAAIYNGSQESALIRNCLDRARIAGLSGEDTYVFLAYHALITLESYAQDCMKFARLNNKALLYMEDKG